MGIKGPGTIKGRTSKGQPGVSTRRRLGAPIEVLYVDELRSDSYIRTVHVAHSRQVSDAAMNYSISRLALLTGYWYLRRAVGYCYWLLDPTLLSLIYVYSSCIYIGAGSMARCDLTRVPFVSLDSCDSTRVASRYSRLAYA